MSSTAILKPAAESTEPSGEGSRQADLFGGGGGTVEATFTGNSGNNTINGTSSGDFFNMGDGGNDTVNGLGGNDVFTFGAALTAADSINGGTGTDSLILNGNYAAGVTFLATTMTGVEEMDLLGATNSYKLTMNDGNVGSGATLVVSAAGLDAAHSLTLDAFAEANGFYNITGGAGADTITVRGSGNTVNGGGGKDIISILGGAAGHDVINGGAAGDAINFGGTLFNATDQVDGGTGTDVLNLGGNYSAGVVLGATTLLNVEAINLASGHAYTLTTHNATIGAGQHLLVDGSALFSSSDTLIVDGSAETDGNFQIEAGAANDTLTTGGGNDGIDGWNGNDIINPGAGTDAVNGGQGNDIINLGANLDASDQFNGAGGLNTLNLQGNYAAGLTLAAGTIQNFQTINLNGDFSYDLTFNDGNFTGPLTTTIKDAASGVLDTITIDASAETSAVLNVVLSGPEQFHIALGGGNDTVTVAKQMSSFDTFDGGGSLDSLHFTGGNTGHLALGITNIQNFSTLFFEGAGTNYDVSLSDATFVGGAASQIWDGGQASGTLTIDNSSEFDTAVSFDLGGGETKFITAGSMNDSFRVHGALKTTDHLDGGAGTNNITFDGDYSAGLTLGAATLANITHLSFEAGHNYKIVTDDANFAVGNEIFVTTSVGFANKLNFNGSAESDAYFNLSGGSGDDTLSGGANGDLISTGLGTDLVQGNGGDDFILMLNGAYSFADGINGGAGIDTLMIGGDYTLGVTLGSNIAAVEKISVVDGTDYMFTTADALVAAGQSLGINASTLTGAHKLTFDGSAESNGTFSVFTGTGDDVVVTGAGDDQIHFTTGTDLGQGNGGNDEFWFLTGGLDAADTLNGGAGSDRLVVKGDGGPTVILGATTLNSVETIYVIDGANYSLATHDGNVPGGIALTIDAQTLSSPYSLDFDGSAETDGILIIKGGAGGDGLTGGAGGDIISGGAGNDEIVGGAGDDAIDGGSGFDQIDGGDGDNSIDLSQGSGTIATGWIGNDVFVAGTALFTGVVIDGGDDSDTVQVSGDYAAGVTFDAATMTNVEALVATDGAFSYRFTSHDATVAAGANLTIDGSAIDAAHSLTFSGAAESDGTFVIIGGMGDDFATGGAGSDTFDFTRGGDDTGTGGAGDDLFLMGAALDGADRLLGAGNSDTVALNGNYAAGTTLAATTLTSIETMTFGPRFSYKLTMDDGNVGAGKRLVMDGSGLNVDHWLKIDGSAETNGRYSMLGGDASDVLTGGAGSDRFQGGRGADLLTGGGGVDTFVYKGALESTDAGYDTLVGFDFASDLIDVKKVTGIDSAITGGSLSTATFNADLSAVFGAPQLLSHHAALFTADAGTLAGHTFLVVDANGTAGYQAGGDYVFDVTGAANLASLSLADFV